MDLKKHVDTIVIMTAILGSFLWMQVKFSAIEKDITIIKTVLITKNYMTSDIFTNKEQK